MKKALQVTGLAVLAFVVLITVAIAFAIIGALFVVITASGIIALAIIGIVTPKEKLKKIVHAIDVTIEDED